MLASQCAKCGGFVIRECLDPASVCLMCGKQVWDSPAIPYRRASGTVTRNNPGITILPWTLSPSTYGPLKCRAIGPRDSKGQTHFSDIVLWLFA